MKSPIKITCAQKVVLLPKPFLFNFDCEYTEYENLSQLDLETKVFDQDILIISNLSINETILKNNPNLKLIALSCTGYNHIDIDLLKRRNIKLCNVQHYAGDSVAEHAFMLMINLFRNYNLQQYAVQSKNWSYSGKVCYVSAPMRELNGKTLAIIGKGDIGLSLARKAQAFGMKVIFSERKGSHICREGYIPFEESIKQADVISLHCNLTKETENLIDKQVFSLMKKGGILINVSRGKLVNTVDVIEALENQTLLGFGTDVLDCEPPPIDHPLLQLNHPNLIITSHIAWATEEAKERLFSILESNINNNVKGIDQNRIC